MGTNAVNITKYITKLSYGEKVEVRKYLGGRKHIYIFQGNRWYQMEKHWFDFLVEKGTIIPDCSYEEWRKVAYDYPENLSGDD